MWRHEVQSTRGLWGSQQSTLRVSEALGTFFHSQGTTSLSCDLFPDLCYQRLKGLPQDPREVAVTLGGVSGSSALSRPSHPLSIAHRCPPVLKVDTPGSHHHWWGTGSGGRDLPSVTGTRNPSLHLHEPGGERGAVKGEQAQSRLQYEVRTVLSFRAPIIKGMDQREMVATLRSRRTSWS